MLYRSAYSGIVSDWFIIKLARRNRGIFEPEQRLWLFALTTILVPACQILWGVGVSLQQPGSSSLAFDALFEMLTLERLPITSTGLDSLSRCVFLRLATQLESHYQSHTSSIRIERYQETA